MTRRIDLAALLAGCADDSFDNGMRLDTELEPLSGRGGPVKPAVYDGGKYQQDRRWASPTDAEATPVIVIDNVPSQANRLEDALRRNRAAAGLPEIVLDLSSLESLPPHLPRQISSFQFPHRNADAYLRDAQLDGRNFVSTSVGKAIFDATADTCGALMAWFPQALLFGFWQSHLGKKRSNAKHPRSWVSEIVGWNPAATDTRVMGLKGDALNLTRDVEITSNQSDRLRWTTGKGAVEGGKRDKLSEIGHGQVPFMTEKDSTPAGVSFTRVHQRATVSFAQLRRVSLGLGRPDADAAVRAVLVALGLYAHIVAFGRGFALRSGAELRPTATNAVWLGGEADTDCEVPNARAMAHLLREARNHARSQGVPLDGWGEPPLVLTPKKNLRDAIRATWPDLGP